MAEVATGFYRPDLVDENGQPSALVSPTVEVLNGHTSEMRFLGKKLNKKKKKIAEKERLLREARSTQFPPASGQETIFAEECLAVEPVEDQEPLVAVPEEVPEVAVPEEIPEVAVPEDDPVPEAESAHDQLAESPLPGHINGATEIDTRTPEPQELIFLPFSAQHKLMVHLQERLETICFSFAQRVMPHALKGRGWDCPEMVQLHHWMDDSDFKRYLEQWVPNEERREQLLNSVIEIRRCAVNRKRIDTVALDALLSSALELAAVLAQQTSVNELEQLRDSVVQTSQRFTDETHILQDRCETKLQAITAGRARLDAMEEKVKAALSKKLEQSRSMANNRIILLIREAESCTPKVALPGGSTTRSCLDWMNDLESSLALGEDDHEDFAG
ncbi:hypothetical protein FGADI_5940 [Fusarium gaditjirri]|uniref:Uncharacterized protein n=1 Tax=Fusarium gaditjirri TaxID=282569 RepID=A0A8H4T973_9HYPO|nr:hypothetical protein FGADI_5940 [Fusarium gaditjirri]